MADEEESLISQEDIDKLLDASSLEDAEARVDAPQNDAPEEFEEMGELSQDDIDSLLNGNLAGEDSPDEFGGEEEELGELSQDDIDSLLNGNLTGEDSSDEAYADEEDDDELELISQDDIDRLLSGSDDDEPGADDEADDDEFEEDDDELITIDDIKDLIGDAVDESPGPLAEEASGDDGRPEPETTEMDSSEPETPELERPDESVSDSGVDPLDEPLVETDALSVSDCLITQETMDDLIRAAQELPSGEDSMDEVFRAEAGDDELAEEFEAEPDLDLDEDFTVDLGDELSGDMEENDVVDLASSPRDPGADGDVTQEDIDALLSESDEDVNFLEDDEDILISQDDIDTLLMAADQEDEDVLSGLLGDEGDGLDDDLSLDDTLGAMDDDGIGELEEDDDTDQVVLESDSPSEDEAVVPGRLQKLLKSKLVLATASALLVLGICIPAAYFLFFSGEKLPELPADQAVPVADLNLPRAIEVDSGNVAETEAPVVRKSGTVVLTDFVILASDQSKKMTYVYADIAIDYSDQRAYHEISNNLSFYRDLIYESIQANLASERRDQVTESDLIWGIEASLKKVLPPHYIEKISFKTFGTS